jgi:putative solute:sodium symporter small subunit
MGTVKMVQNSSPAHPRAAEHWQRTRSLMWITLAIWFFFGYFVHFFAVPLNQIVILGFPLGFYMAAQGSLIAFVILIFWFAHQQNRIDEECGVEER